MDNINNFYQGKGRKGKFLGTTINKYPGGVTVGLKSIEKAFFKVSWPFILLVIVFVILRNTAVEFLSPQSLKVIFRITLDLAIIGLLIRSVGYYIERVDWPKQKQDS